MVTGQSDNYWTAICLNDEFFEEDPRLLDDEIPPVDPIIQIPPPSAGNFWSPRAYALLALGLQLEKIIEHHRDVHYHLKISLNRYVSSISASRWFSNRKLLSLFG